MSNYLEQTENTTIPINLFAPGEAVNGTLYDDNIPAELGMKFRVERRGQITALRYYRDPTDAEDTDVRDGHLWRVSDGELLSTAIFNSSVGQSGWQTAVLDSPVTVVPGEEYIVSYKTLDNYLATEDFFSPDHEIAFDGVNNDAFSDPSGLLNAPQGLNGVYKYGGDLVMPDETFEFSNYWTDISFEPSIPSHSLLPIITLVVSSTSLSQLGVPGSVFEDGISNLLLYTFRRSGDTSEELTVNYTVSGTADSEDYTGIIPTGQTKTVTFPAGSATTTVKVDPTADAIVEPDETVELTLVPDPHYEIGTPEAVRGTILNDDAPSITLTVDPVSVLEDGQGKLIYTFSRSDNISEELTVNYTVGGTATNSIDYAPIGTSVTFPAGSATASVAVVPTPDDLIEPDETVDLTLSAGIGYFIDTPRPVSGIITNDDQVSSPSLCDFDSNLSNVSSMKASILNLFPSESGF